MLLALASGVCLLGVVGHSLVQALQQALDRATLAAERDARDVATALRALLRTRDVLDLVPGIRRVHWAGGSIHVDDEVGWLHAAPPRTPDALIDERLRLAEIAEFVRCDGAAATTVHDDSLAQAGARGDAPLPLLGAAAWHAQRAGANERADALAHRLLQALEPHGAAAVADPAFAAAVASTALLLAARGDALPAQVATLLAALPPELAATTFARLNERGAHVAATVAAHARVAERRRVLAVAATAMRELPAATAMRVAGERLVLWFPAAQAGSGDGDGDGDGAVVDAAWLAALPGLGTTRPSPVPTLPPVPDRGVVHASATPPHAGAVEAIPGFVWIEPAPAPPLPWTSHPGALLGAALLLGLVFAGSAFAIAHAARREAQALRARTDFLTGVTHELKTPLAAIRLVADVLRDDDVPPQRQREYFALLAAETARLSSLIENVLDLGRAERGERVYDVRDGDLAAVVRDAVATFSPLAQRAGIDVTLHEGSAALPAAIDAGALQQALLAVLDNARKYAAAGVRIHMTTHAHDGAFTIAVRDFGNGVPAGERDAIFERFQRGSAHRHGTVPGVGLGLFLARAIVEHHGGTLRCEQPAEGPGARFVFTLPVTTRSPAEATT